MHAMTRLYTGKGAAELAKLLVSRKAEVEKLIGGIPGLVSYNIMKTGDGCVTVTVCRDKAGTDKSLSVAREWLKANTGHLDLKPPVVSEGEVVLHLGSEVSAA